MKNIISLLFFISSLLVNVSAKSENLDIMYLSSAYSMGKIFEKLNLTLNIIPQLAPETLKKLKILFIKQLLQSQNTKKKKIQFVLMKKNLFMQKFQH